ncbi:MAG TPA: isoprenylcysteine carboxylmethyltransferase family protein [Rhodocyclaceae bacterium]
MKALELKIPPPVLALAVAFGIWLIARAWPGFGFAFPGQNIAAAVLAGAGIAFALAGVAAFHRANTTHHPMRPHDTATLVTTGPYRVSRNPMYVGVLAALAAWALFLGSALGFVLLPLLVAYLNRFQIGPEERVLAGKFGEEFVAYQRAVRRWI